ncbi:hypothetical protein AB1Y20_014234 [Prymnesium parvum]|uniref:Guanine nucleotide-binding protein subunit beta-like protein n=1 Tax=Prymnesium parvum TaxID=97485 RepID=A0AB34ID48_PRYPA
MSKPRDSAWNNLASDRLWSIGKLRQVRLLTGHNSKITSASWHRNSEHLITTDQSGNVILWDAMQKAKLRYINKPFITASAISPDPDKTIVALGGLDNVICIYNMSSSSEGPPVMKVELPSSGEGHEGSITSLHFCTIDKLISAAGDGDIRVWDANTGTCSQVLAGHARDAVSLSFQHDAVGGPMFASGSLDGTVRLWDLRSGKSFATFTMDDEVNGCAMFPDGRAVAGACVNGAVSVYDVRAQQRVQHMVVSGKVSACTGVQFSISGRALYTSHENGCIGCWEPYGATSGCKALVAAHTAAQQQSARSISALSLSPDGTALVSAAYDAQVKVWAAQPSSK